MPSDVDVAAILADYGVRLKTLRAGHSEKVLCPKCHGGRTKEKSLSVTVDADGCGVVLRCHRAKECGWKDGRRTIDGAARAYRKPVEPPTPPPFHDAEAIRKPTTMYDFFAQRGISRETADLFGCYVTKHWFPDGDHQPALVFPYLFDGRIVNRKYRSPAKMFIQEKNPLPTLFNVDAVAEPDVVWWVEGEADVMAMHEAGYVQTVTLANGAPHELRDEDDPRREDDKRFLALGTHSTLLGRVKKFVLAGDMDGPGDVLREELARRLGRHRCWLVTWPEGSKDACDVLRQHGAAGVQAAVEAARKYPVQGLQQTDAGTLVEARHHQRPAVMTTGTIATNKILSFPTEGRLIVITGVPSAGKSVWLKFVSLHLMAEHNRKFLVFSPEMQPWQEFAIQCAETLMGKRFYPGDDDPGMTDAEITAAEDWLRDRLIMLVTDSTDTAPTLDWVLEMASICILRDGVTDLQIDPWNELEHDRGSKTEAEYTSASLQRIKAFALRHGVNVWIATHPVKMQPPRTGEKMQAPGMYDINGGAMWNNKADIGITVHRPELTTQIILRKSRFLRWGRRGAQTELTFDAVTGRYTSAALMDDIEERRQQWND